MFDPVLLVLPAGPTIDVHRPAVYLVAFVLRGIDRCTFLI